MEIRKRCTQGKKRDRAVKWLLAFPGESSLHLCALHWDKKLSNNYILFCTVLFCSVLFCSVLIRSDPIRSLSLFLSLSLSLSLFLSLSFSLSLLLARWLGYTLYLKLDARLREILVLRRQDRRWGGGLVVGYRFDGQNPAHYILPWVPRT